MGYILPINHYQNQYEKQVKKRKIKQTVEKPYKVILEKKHEDMRSQYDQFNYKAAQTSKKTNHSEVENHIDTII